MDYTLCVNSLCESKDRCWRYQKALNPENIGIRQSYKCELDADGKSMVDWVCNKCNIFIDTKEEKK